MAPAHRERGAAGDSRKRRRGEALTSFVRSRRRSRGAKKTLFDSGTRSAPRPNGALPSACPDARVARQEHDRLRAAIDDYHRQYQAERLRLQDAIQVGGLSLAPQQAAQGSSRRGGRLRRVAVPRAGQSRGRARAEPWHAPPRLTHGVWCGGQRNFSTHPRRRGRIGSPGAPPSPPPPPRTNWTRLVLLPRTKRTRYPRSRPAPWTPAREGAPGSIDL